MPDKHKRLTDRWAEESKEDYDLDWTEEDDKASAELEAELEAMDKE